MISFAFFGGDCSRISGQMYDPELVNYVSTHSTKPFISCSVIGFIHPLQIHVYFAIGKLLNPTQTPPGSVGQRKGHVPHSLTKEINERDQS